MILLAIFEPTLIPFFRNVLCPESLLLGVLLDGHEYGPADRPRSYVVREHNSVNNCSS